MIRLILLLIAVTPTAALAQQSIRITEPSGLHLQATLYLPTTPSLAPAIVALHGCAGPLPKRDNAWAAALAAQGHAVLLPNSFASRGAAPVCKQTSHAVSAYTARRTDALAAATWLQTQKFAPPGGILLLGWSDGATTILATIAPGAPKHLIRGAAAFYPACTRTARNPTWHATAPLLILIGAADDWTPPAPCQRLAARDPATKIQLFPAAYHDFDVPNDPIHLVTGLPYTKYPTGTAHAGSNPAAREKALQIVPAFFNTLPPAP